LLVPPKRDDLSLAGLEGVVAVHGGRVVVLELVLGRLYALVLQLVDRVHVQRDVVFEAASLGLAGKLGGSLGLKFVKTSWGNFCDLNIPPLDAINFK
jgi:hypothetical protein